ncbi:5'-nucleotidase C-terminal domain-containing protein [Maribacter sp. 2308TA10-17]|uniref:5'-nucleotidase C-terminal domain-containing protein n=1 Tax=Maribacter sp. 2308TA10-17 TaxID=3386276 RepID=UPI0039BD078D
MNLKIQQFVIIVTLLIFSSCKEPSTILSKINAKQVPIDSTFIEVDSIEKFVAPYRNRVNQVLDSALAYAPAVLTKEDGKYNTSAGNLMADIVLKEANPIYKSRTGKDIDFVLLNHGGIRSAISKGNVSARTAYEVMPFENSVVVVELSGKSVLKMVEFLIHSNRAHPIAGMQIVINKKDELQSIKIQGKVFDEKRNYYVATSNYLVTGGDNMGFFKNMIDATDTDYLIRNAMIDHFKKADTIHAEVDNRFYKIN